MYQLTTLNTEVEVPTEEDRACDVSSSGRADTEMYESYRGRLNVFRNLNNLVINENQNQDQARAHPLADTSSSKAYLFLSLTSNLHFSSQFEYRPESSKRFHRRNKPIAKRFSSMGSSTLPLFHPQMPGPGSCSSTTCATARSPSPENVMPPTFPPSPERFIPCEKDDQTSDTSL